jgi:hypothetical protein
MAAEDSASALVRTAATRPRLLIYQPIYLPMVHVVYFCSPKASRRNKGWSHNGNRTSRVLQVAFDDLTRFGCVHLNRYNLKSHPIILDAYQSTLIYKLDQRYAVHYLSTHMNRPLG